jgi:hypothetical protein
MVLPKNQNDDYRLNLSVFKIILYDHYFLDRLVSVDIISFLLASSKFVRSVAITIYCLDREAQPL